MVTLVFVNNRFNFFLKLKEHFGVVRFHPNKESPQEVDLQIWSTRENTMRALEKPIEVVVEVSEGRY